MSCGPAWSSAVRHFFLLGLAKCLRSSLSADMSLSRNRRAARSWRLPPHLRPAAASRAFSSSSPIACSASGLSYAAQSSSVGPLLPPSEPAGAPLLPLPPGEPASTATDAVAADALLPLEATDCTRADCAQNVSHASLHKHTPMPNLGVVRMP